MGDYTRPALAVGSCYSLCTRAARLRRGGALPIATGGHMQREKGESVGGGDGQYAGEKRRWRVSLVGWDWRAHAIGCEGE